LCVNSSTLLCAQLLQVSIDSQERWENQVLLLLQVLQTCIKP
jgi:hypothetical protein